MSTMMIHTRPVAQAYPLRWKPERKVWRVGTPYTYRHPNESLACAACAFLTAHYRIVHRSVRRFAVNLLAQQLSRAQDPWDAAKRFLFEEGVPYEGGRRPQDPSPAPFLPRQVLVAHSLDEVLSALAEVGPVLLWLPWSANYAHESQAYGVPWIGPDGQALRGVYSHEFRGVLLKGVAWKYRGVCVLDGERDDLWMPHAELNRLLHDGARAVTAIF